MPVFHNPERSTTPLGKSTRDESSNVQNSSEDSGWSKNQLIDIEMSDVSLQNHSTYDYTFSPLQNRSRDELIRSIKRGESPTWNRQDVESKPRGHMAGPDPSFNAWSFESNKDEDASSSNIMQEDVPRSTERSELDEPSQIERPRSALHTGDFREGVPQTQPADFHDLADFSVPPRGYSPFKHLASSPTTPWFNHDTSSRFVPKDIDMTPSKGQVKSAVGSRSRTPSLGSFSSSYVLKAPTSPLVYQANNPDVDFSPNYEPVTFSRDDTKSNRRRTLPPETFMQLRGSPPPSSHSRNFSFSRSFASANGSEDTRHQAYQPHRSSTYSLQPASSPRIPFQFRRLSFASDRSPRIHASMVGSYEESILRGRMSTTPSKPLNFTAQIGVLGRGKCKSNLRCPPHITVPFPAVFYSYPTSGTGRSISDDSPSPYVGLIELDNALPRDNSGEKKKPHDQKTLVSGNSRASTPIPSSELNKRRKRENRSGRSDAMKAPPEGSYRIPQRGQLQIIIKNPNKTAVKLFLVPYDLDDMEPGTKTFIRQRSYSAGPIIDMPLTARKNFGTDRPEASLNPTNDPRDKPTLRYLIHLNICCTSKGRFYLYSTVRVVFANRVPDGKEKLRNEIQYPEPRYSPYKPIKEPKNPNHTSPTMDNKNHRASAEFGFSGGQFFESRNSPGVSCPFLQQQQSSSSSISSNIQVTTVSPPPFKLSITKSRAPASRDGSTTSIFSNNDFWQTSKSTPPVQTSVHDCDDDDRSPSPKSSGSPYMSNSSKETSNNNNNNTNENELYSKFQKEDIITTNYYGSGSSTDPTSPTKYSSVGESLLAQKLKEWNCNNEQQTRDSGDTL